jgi:hypothetical protein
MQNFLWQEAFSPVLMFQDALPRNVGLLLMLVTHLLQSPYSYVLIFRSKLTFSLSLHIFLVRFNYY